MTALVLKFGGTSVANAERIAHVASVIAEVKAKTKDSLVVVVSAKAGDTNRLIQMAFCQNEMPDAREYDALISTGERQSAALLALALHKLGVQACSMSGEQAGIVTDNHHKRAHIKYVQLASIFACWEKNSIPIVAGFQGVAPEGDVTTLGRGGSDTSAVALAKALNARACHFYTDVDGVYSADPRLIDEALHLKKISYDSMLAFCSLGARVLHCRALQMAMEAKIPLRIRSSFDLNHEGTLITHEPDQYVQALAIDANQALVKLKPAQTCCDFDAFLQHLSYCGIDVDIVTHSDSHFYISVHLDDMRETLVQVQRFFEGQVRFDAFDQVVKMSLIGFNERQDAVFENALVSFVRQQGVDPILLYKQNVCLVLIVLKHHASELARLLHSKYIYPILVQNDHSG